MASRGHKILRRFLGRAFVLLALAGCDQVPPEGAEGQQAPLVNATLDTGDPAVGWIGSCTATLIGRKTVLSAAHCIPQDGGRMLFCTYPCGNLNNCAGQCVWGTAHIFPGYGNDFGHDASIVNLDQDFTSLYGIVPRRIGSAPSGGESLYLVGYGCTDWNQQSTYGTKRSGYNVISSVGSDVIESNDTSRTYGCPGDSGGPAFVTGTDCELAINVGRETYEFWPFSWTDYDLTRVDTKAAWIQSASGDPSVYLCGHTVCGDGFCQSPEDCTSCTRDCGSCPPPGQCGTQPDGYDCGDDCCNGYRACKGGVCTANTCCNTAKCCAD